MADADFTVVPNLRGKSNIWNHFGLKKRKVDGQITDNVAICNSCQAEVKTGGGTSNMFFHMSFGVHNRYLQYQAQLLPMLQLVL